MFMDTPLGPSGEEPDDELMELKELLAHMLPIVLDDPGIGSLFSGAAPYYARLVNHVSDNDLCTLDIVKELAQRVRSRYKSWHEYQAEMCEVPVERTPGSTTTAADICCICHEPLSTWRKVWRLKPASSDPSECGHMLHHRCVMRLRPDADGLFQCPMCRASLGHTVETWLDTTSEVPRF